MRKTEAGGWMGRSSSKALRRGAQFAVVALGIGLVMATGAARAQEDDDDDKTFEEKIIEGIMAGVGGTNMDNRGIDYRERSPLVVPPKLDLPPPATAAAEVKDPNWPRIRTMRGARPPLPRARRPNPIRSKRPAC